jgi:hypothetical protein
MFAALFAETWVFWMWLVVIVFGIMGWGLLKAATGPVGKGALWLFLNTKK